MTALRLSIIGLALCATASAQTSSPLDSQQSGPGRLTVFQDSVIARLVNTARVTQPRAERQAPSRAEAPVSSPKAAAAPKPAEPTTAQRPADEKASLTGRTRYQAQGYRIQVFTGGNSRSDKQRAQQMLNTCRKSFPELSGYVHFVSPHWICRVGDFKDKEEAQNYAAKIRRMGISYEARVVRSYVLLAR